MYVCSTVFNSKYLQILILNALVRSSHSLIFYNASTPKKILYFYKYKIKFKHRAVAHLRCVKSGYIQNTSDINMKNV